jgi:hypothetical protein
MCYPHGGHDAPLARLLRERGCVIGLAVETGLAHLGRHDPLALPRLDTNHLPRASDAAPSQWTAAAGA